jgi:hypothetical protein
MAALYLERFMNYGITPDELRSGKPIIGIAQSGSDIAPCNRIHLETVKRARQTIRANGTGGRAYGSYNPLVVQRGANLAARAPPECRRGKAQPSIASSSLPLVSWMNRWTRKKLITAQTA